MGELLLSGARVTLQRQPATKRATAYDLISVCKPGLGWVNIDSLAPNVLMKLHYCCLSGIVREKNREIRNVRSRFRTGNHRLMQTANHFPVFFSNAIKE